MGQKRKGVNIFQASPESGRRGAVNYVNGIIKTDLRCLIRFNPASTAAALSGFRSGFVPFWVGTRLEQFNSEDTLKSK